MTQMAPSLRVDKLNKLLKSDQDLFHTQDLALLWGVENRNTLYTTIKRYIKKGVLTKITKGLYSTRYVEDEKLGPALIHKFCYLSCETVLGMKGVINQKVHPLIYVSSVSRRIKLNASVFIFRKMNPKFLLNPEGIYIDKDLKIYMATLERAVADMNYFNPKYYFDNPNLINWDRVNEIKMKVGY